MYSKKPDMTIRTFEGLEELMTHNEFPVLVVGVRKSRSGLGSYRHPYSCSNAAEIEMAMPRLKKMIELDGRVEVTLA